MSFEQHLFISYAHLDNQPLTPEQEGWITRFHATLEALLSMRMGCEARIWRDDKLQGNDVFADEIVKQFSQTALLLTVLTPRYLKSEWCNREVEEFCKSVDKVGDMVVDNKARVFKVLKSPLDTEEQLPSVMQDVLGYEFFTYHDDAPLELDPAYGDEYAQDYNRKVGKLAWDIAGLLKHLETENADLVRKDPGEDKPTVYLAEVSRDHRQVREILEGDLRRHGYEVLPDQALPNDYEEDYLPAVTALLQRCELAIHLVGAAPGPVPDGESHKSVVVLQNELAVKRCKSAALSRVIWLPEGTHSEHVQHQDFIDEVHGNAESQFGADVITGNLEELKNTIHTTLKKLEKPDPEQSQESVAAKNEQKLIYLICDAKDRKATVPIRKFCREQGFEVAIPAFEGDANAVRQAHQALMGSCDAVVLFYGAGDEAWKRTTDNELKKMPGYRAGKQLLTTCTYLAAPMTSDKEDLIDMEEPGLINGCDGFSHTLLAELVQAMGANGELD